MYTDSEKVALCLPYSKCMHKTVYKTFCSHTTARLASAADANTIVAPAASEVAPLQPSVPSGQASISELETAALQSSLSSQRQALPSSGEYWVRRLPSS